MFIFDNTFPRISFFASFSFSYFPIDGGDVIILFLIYKTLFCSPHRTGVSFWADTKKEKS